MTCMMRRSTLMNSIMLKSTKQLAKELGLLRKRPLSTSSPRTVRKRQRNEQHFTHLIVIDFESTCWENDKLKPQEIIEFPAILLNTSTGQVEDEFHYYLQPSEQPFLSDFCMQLTGISQETVDNGIPLSMCMRKFAAWLRKLSETRGIVCADERTSTSASDGKKVAALGTWSDWDLGVCLLYEAKRKQITRPSALNCWIDLRATYRKFYQRRPEGLNGALKELGIEFDGREHSGLDDARNTARLAWKMVCDGCVMALTKSLKTGSIYSAQMSSRPVSAQPSVANSFSKQQATAANQPQKQSKQPFTIAKDDSVAVANFSIVARNRGLSERNQNTMRSQQCNSPTNMKKPSLKPLSSHTMDNSTLSKVISSNESYTTSHAQGKAVTPKSKNAEVTPLRRSPRGHGNTPSKPSCLLNTKADISQPMVVKNSSLTSPSLQVFSATTSSPKSNQITKPKNLSKSFNADNSPIEKIVTDAHQNIHHVSCQSKASFHKKIPSPKHSHLPVSRPPSVNCVSQPFKNPRLCAATSTQSTAGHAAASTTPEHSFTSKVTQDNTSHKNNDTSKIPKTLSTKSSNTLKARDDDKTPNQVFQQRKHVLKTPSPNTASRTVCNSTTTLNNTHRTLTTPSPSINTTSSTLTRIKQVSNQYNNKNNFVQTPTGTTNKCTKTEVLGKKSDSVFKVPTPPTTPASNGNTPKYFSNISQNINSNTIGPSSNEPMNSLHTPNHSSKISPNNSISGLLSNKPMNSLHAPNHSSKVSLNNSNPTGPSSNKPMNSLHTPNYSTKVSPKNKNISMHSSNKSRNPFKTPSPTNTMTNTTTTMRATPPLCKCGRRSRRRQVQNCGPNMGRLFFSCSLGRPSSGVSTPGAGRGGCGFFQWDVHST